MTSSLATLRSSLGSKYLMAVSGAILLLWIVGHLAGNLQAFPFLGGRRALNDYAQWLKQHAGLLWTARTVMAAVLVVHVVTGLRLALANRAARPERYHAPRYEAATYASRSIVLTGLVIATYLVYHLLHLTLGVTNPDHFHSREVLPGGGERHDVYTMLVLGFRQPAISIVYLVAMVLLGLHVSHGASSMLQSLGISHPRYDRALRRIGPLLGAALAAGYIALPVGVWVGILGLPES